MPKIHEIYGSISIPAQGTPRNASLSAACPFTGTECDGGGNRHQTTISMGVQEPLVPYFSQGLDKIVPGVCSIGYEKEKWIVCPRRIFGFRNAKSTIPVENFGLQAHERDALLAAGVIPGRRYGIWSEIYLRFNDDNSDINYHFDFIIAPIQENVSIRQALAQLAITHESELEESLVKSARIGGLVSGRWKSSTRLPLIPNLASPLIFEIMTASTSGSDTKKGTDIAAAFRNAVIHAEHDCPGINKRQVWGRMATQLFAKSAIAEAWGGRTYWVVQDQLINNLERTTRLDLSKRASDTTRETIEFLVMEFGPKSATQHAVRFSRRIRMDSGIDFTGGDGCVDILLPKQIPSKLELLKSMLRRPVQALIRL